MIAGLIAVSAPASAHAFAPGVVYIPAESIDLVPVSMCPILQGGQANSGIGCGGGSRPQTVAPYAGDLDALVASVEDAVSDYDIHVTTERPPAYVPYLMVMPSEVDDAESTSFSCVAAGIGCGGVKRNSIARTLGSTQNCDDPDVVHAVLYAIGRSAGLEGIDDATDVMGYVPDYTAPVTSFRDSCALRVNQIGFNDQDEQITLPLECTSLDHVGCEDSAEQNSHADMLEVFGPRVVDTDPPVFSNVTPGDGVLVDTSQLILDVDIADADPIVGVRWTLESDALASVGIEAGRFSRCTNNACMTPMSVSPFNWQPETFKPTDSDWSVDMGGLPGGVYTITLEASDFHGNEAVTTFKICLQGDVTDCDGFDPAGTGTGTGPDDGADSGFADDTGDGEGDNGQADTGSGGGGVDEGTTSDDASPMSGADASADGDTEGAGQLLNPLACDCRQASPKAPPFVLTMLVLLGLRRRRRRVD